MMKQIKKVLALLIALALALPVFAMAETENEPLCAPEDVYISDAMGDGGTDLAGITDPSGAEVSAPAVDATGVGCEGFIDLSALLDGGPEGEGFLSEGAVAPGGATEGVGLVEGAVAEGNSLRHGEAVTRQLTNPVFKTGHRVYTCKGKRATRPPAS